MIYVIDCELNYSKLNNNITKYLNLFIVFYHETIKKYKIHQKKSKYLESMAREKLKYFYYTYLYYII